MREENEKQRKEIRHDKLVCGIASYCVPCGHDR